MSWLKRARQVSPSGYFLAALNPLQGPEARIVTSRLVLDGHRSGASLVATMTRYSSHALIARRRDESVCWTHPTYVVVFKQTMVLAP